MTKADEIRRLAKDGMAVADIARSLGIRYQHAYGVLRRSGLQTRQKPSDKPPAAKKRPLSAQTLLDAGFEKGAEWRIVQDRLMLSRALPDVPGVYAFIMEETAQYVGLASMGLAKRIRFYARPGVTQRTSLRLNGILKDICARGEGVSVLFACPDTLNWNGLPVHGAAGLEMGLIKAFALPWNIRGAS